MDKKEMICIVCPIGCHIEVVEDESVEGGYRVDGANCKRGKMYGVKELTRPTRLLTSTVEIEGAVLPRLPVRTKEEIPKDKMIPFEGGGLGSGIHETGKIYKKIKKQADRKSVV